MKKLSLLLVLIFILSPILMTSCSKEKTVTLNVYNWGEYISSIGQDTTYDTIAEFEKYFNTHLASKYGHNIEVNYTTYATNEDMYSKLASGAGDGVYDVIFPSDYMLQRMASEGMLHKFNVAEEIENYKYIDDKYKKMYYDEFEQYSVPYTFGMVGIIYNPTLMHPDDIGEDGEIKKKSWSIMWNEGYVGDYAGNILQFNNPRDAFASAMLYHGIDINTPNREEWQEALGYMRDQKDILQGYVNDEIFNKMTSESAAIAPYFAGDYITMSAENENLKFFYPEEGTNVFVDAMCIPESSKHKDLAKEFINFMLMDEPALENALYIGYASPNTRVKNILHELIESGNEELMSADEYEILYGDHSDIPTSYYYSFSDEKIYGKDMQKYVNSLWEQLKTETDVEPWVHVSSIIIVVALLAGCSYSIYIKKKRSKFYRQRDKDAKKA